ncbi:MAG: type IV toxin-antitoxin system AbiEi family antitoxin [Polaromonas sp.]
MDKLPAYPEVDLLNAALDVARGLGLDARLEQREPGVENNARADALVRIGRGGEGALYVAEVRRQLRPTTLGIALHQLARFKQPGLLIADHITPPMAEELRTQRIAFLDAAGNAYIEQPNVLVWVTGRKPLAKEVTRPVGRAFQPTGLQVLFALLCNPQWVILPYRELAARAGVAHGTVGWVMPDLQQQGFVADLKGKRGTRRLFDGERLLALWADAYARQLRPRTLMGRYYVYTLEGWQDWRLAEYGAQWGSEPAATLLTHYLKPGELTIYADKLPGLLAARHKFAKEADMDHKEVVEVRRRFWNFPADAMAAQCVPPLLVYADLLATGDARCIETAKRLYEDHVARPVRQA